MRSPEKLELSPTIEKAETYVSVHSSHHTPPGLLFGRFLILGKYRRQRKETVENLSKCIYLTGKNKGFLCDRIFRKVSKNIAKDFQAMSAAAQVSDSTFKQEVLDSEVPVLVDFWAPWCGPCRMVAPVVDEIAQQYDGQVKVVKLNTDENPNVASQYGIRSIPTLMIFKGGQKVDMVVGAVPKTTLSNTLEKYL